MRRFPVGGEAYRRFLLSKRGKDDLLSQKGTRVAQKFYTGSGQTCPKNGEFTRRCFGYASNNVARRLDRQVLVEHLMEPSIDFNRDEGFLVMITPSWMDPIWDYLLNGTLPSDSKESSKLRARLARFALLWGTLYKQGFSVPLL